MSSTLSVKDEKEGASPLVAATALALATDPFLGMVQAMTATGIEILEGYVNGDVVLLRVVLGVGSHREHGVLEIERHGQAWRLAQESWDHKRGER
jgi:hypothetical protein